MSTPTATRYIAPDWANRHLVNPIVTLFIKLGAKVRGARELHVRGRATGEWRTNPVNLLEYEGRTYLVAPRGETQWVRNLRVAGGGRLRSGRRFDEFTAREVADADKTPLLREYLRLWAWEVGKFFDGLSVDSTDDEIDAAAPGFPVFELVISADA